MVIYKVHTEFQLNRKQCLDATCSFTYAHACLNHHKNSINEFKRPQSVQIVKITKSNFLMTTILSLLNVPLKNEKGRECSFNHPIKQKAPTALDILSYLCNAFLIRIRMRKIL